MDKILSGLEFYFNPSDDLEGSVSYKRPQISKSNILNDIYSDYDALGNDKIASGYGSFSQSAYGGQKPCCPLVVDPLSLLALLGFIAAATALLNSVITMNIMAVATGRKRRSTFSRAIDKGNKVTFIAKVKEKFHYNLKQYFIGSALR